MTNNETFIYIVNMKIKYFFEVSAGCGENCTCCISSECKKVVVADMKCIRDNDPDVYRELLIDMKDNSEDWANLEFTEWHGNIDYAIPPGYDYVGVL